MTEEQARQIFDLYKVKNNWIGSEAEFISFYFMPKANALCFEYKTFLRSLKELVYGYDVVWKIELQMLIEETKTEKILIEEIKDTLF